MHPPIALLPAPARCALGAPQELRGPVRLLVRGEVSGALLRRLIPRWRRALGWPLVLQDARTGVAMSDADGQAFAGTVEIVLDARDSDRALESAPTAAAQREFSAGSREGDPMTAGDERYALQVTGTHARLVAPHVLGLHRGIETLLQLVNRGEITECTIDDAPRFAYRGVMLDPARHFLPVGDLLRVLDGMAALKLNVLHLHLSDDQGFRLESVALPRLTGAGSNGEFYTQDDIRYLVRYADERGIRVIPELDMPGHCQSWLVGYPQLAPVLAPLSKALPQHWQLRKQFGIGRGSLDPTREETYVFLDTLLAEVATLFPDELVHIGGDEVHPRAWQGVPHIEAFMRERGMAQARELQGYFTARVAEIIARHGKRSIGWDEVLGAQLPANMIVQAWRSGAARDAALHAGADVIVSSGYYLDLFYPAHAHYDFDPEADAAELHRWEDRLAERPGMEAVGNTVGAMFKHFRGAETDVAAKGVPPGRVIGGEACLWGELVTPELLDRRLFSRLTAFAERLWSAVDLDDHDDFYARHERTLDRLASDIGLQLRDPAKRANGTTDAPQFDRRQVLLDAVEPVKWYARLLGPNLLASRALGEPDAPLRPYDTTTPLNRIADCIAPESLAARRFATLCERWQRTGDAAAQADLQAIANAWREQARLWSAQGAPEDCDGLEPLARRLGELGVALLALLRGQAPQLDGQLQQPCEDVFLIVERDVLRVIDAERRK